MSGQAIYESFVYGDVSGLVRSGAATLRLSDNYQSRAEALARMATAMEDAWRGEAASAARRGASPLAARYEMTVPQIRNATKSIQQQADAFGVARNSVVPVPPMPEKPGFFDNVFSLGNASRDHESQVAAIQSANDHNIAVMAQYENTTRQNAAMLTQIPTALGSFPPLRDDRIQELSGSPIPGATTNPTARPGNGGQSGSGGASQGGASTTSSPQQQFSSTADTGLAQTRPESAKTAPSGVTSADIGAPKPTPAPSLDAQRPGLSLGSIGAGYGSGADPTRGGVPGGPRGAGAFGGPRGAGAGGAGEPGPRGSGAGGMGARGPAGMESPLGRGAAGRAGTPGTSGAAGGARRGESEDDLEHQRPAFLVEADPDELFGSDEATAPPVIGG